MGATGITGKLAVQIARHLGAGRIIVTGRNQTMLEKLIEMGADVAISLNQIDEMIRKAIEAEKTNHHIDIVIDYLWGKPAELLLDILTGHDLHAEAQLTRYVQVGEMAGATISLAGATLRSSAIELSGQGGGSIPKNILQKIPTTILPEIFRLAAEGILTVDTMMVPLSEVEEVWQRKDLDGKRVVITL
ncbi:zinc-binding alcohol dehydrogenase family protein [Pedobacter sp. PAMC26386]|nr:zinc-binding alcohol dehydrogenase family protein [Pedobacter sp. PAMC26386]